MATRGAQDGRWEGAEGTDSLWILLRPPGGLTSSVLVCFTRLVEPPILRS
jgi:hypothetical protein